MGGLAILIVLVVVLIIAGAIWSHQQAAKRREALQQFANQLNLSFYPGHDHSLDEQFPFLNSLCQGDNRYACNILTGTYRGHSICVFDYHYETTSTDLDGNRQTSHHYFAFFILFFDKQFPELLISREGWASKFVQFLGFDDIDFESAEFSRKFLVKSRDKKFAYDICHGQMIEYLLQNRDLNIEIERNCLTLVFPIQRTPEDIRHNLDRLVTVRELFPRYLMEGV